MSGWAACVVLALFVWMLGTGLIWKNSPIARREFPGGPGRLFVGQAVAYSLWLFFLGLGSATRMGLVEEFGLGRWSAIWASAGLVLAAWAVLRLAIPFTRRAANDWERWRSAPFTP